MATHLAQSPADNLAPPFRREAACTGGRKTDGRKTAADGQCTRNGLATDTQRSGGEQAADKVADKVADRGRTG